MGKLLYPIEWVISWIMIAFERVFVSLGMSPTNGWTWALAIAGLTLVIRVLLIPLFVKQIHSSRRTQLIQPELQKIQKKYKGKRDEASMRAQQAETMELYKRTGTNPFSSCLPILLQMPIFFALFRVLNGLDDIARGTAQPIGPLTRELAGQAEASTIFGARLSDTFMGTDDLNTRVLAIILIAVMSISTFTSQHQLMRHNMPASALDNPFAQQQKVLLYVLPIIFAFSGVNFPIGVLIYWTVTNIWSMLQQFYVIRQMPTPGSPAEKAMEERRLAKGKPVKKLTVPGLDAPTPSGATAVSATTGPAGTTTTTTTASGRPLAGGDGGQRSQPVGRKRAKKRRK